MIEIYHIATKEWCANYTGRMGMPLSGWVGPISLCGLGVETWAQHEPDCMTDHPDFMGDNRRKVRGLVNCDACILLFFQEGATADG